MNRNEAITLAQRKAQDWQMPYRVLRDDEPGIQHEHRVEPSASFDSPKGWVLVEVFYPRKDAR